MQIQSDSLKILKKGVGDKGIGIVPKGSDVFPNRLAWFQINIIIIAHLHNDEY